MDQVMDVISIITALLNALAWPLVALFVIIRFTPPLIKLIGGGKDVTIKVLGIEATFTSAVAEATVALGAAEAKKAEEDAGSFGDDVPQLGPGQRRAGAGVPSARSLAQSVTAWVPDAQAQQELQGATVLWVDDNPDNNRFEREAFQALGVRFELSTSTDDALQQLNRRQFEAVISDMGRGQDRDAGYLLLEQLRLTDPSTPFFIYAGSSAVRHRQEALARGAQGSTNSPKELMAMVLQAIREHRKP